MRAKRSHSAVENGLFIASLGAGVAMFECGFWLAFGTSYTLMLNGAVVLAGCWKAA